MSNMLDPAGTESEMKLRGTRSISSGTSSRSRYYSAGSSAYIPTKENSFNCGKTMLYVAGSSKMYYQRRYKNRLIPYDVSKRKPFHSLLNPRAGVGRGQIYSRSSSSRVRSSDSYSESTRDAFPQLFDEEYNYLQFREGLIKTDDKFPVPILSKSLSRSKSLEDLRESPGKGKKVRFQINFDDNSSNGTASSNGSNSLESPSALSNRTSFMDILKGEAIIKNEIESMSMRIEKLDVA